MREFRVWCKNFNQWETHSTFLRSDGTLFQRQNGSLLECRNDTHIVQFFTGIKDKNNKKIFEGDIVNFSNYGMATIEFDDGKFMVTCILDRGEYLADLCDAEVEVIGNIFENPELLGG